MHIKLKPYLIDLLDNYDVTSYSDMPKEFHAKCWDILRAERVNESLELFIEILEIGGCLHNDIECIDLNEIDNTSSHIRHGVSLYVDINAWVMSKVCNCLDEIRLEREEKAMDNSHEDVPRKPQ